MSSSDPYRNLSKASDIIVKLAHHIYEMTRASYSFVWIGRGWDPASSEHATGRALDIIVVPPAWLNKKEASGSYYYGGKALVEWLISNADALNIRHIIYYGQIWKRRYRNTSTAWTKLNRPAGTTGISDLHKDHIHVYLDDTNGYVPNVGILGGTAVAPTPVVPKPGQHLVKPFSLGNVINSIKAGKPHGNITTIQSYLNDNYLKHGQGRLKVDGYWGPNTQRCYAAIQRYYGYRGSDANGIPGYSSLTRLLGQAYRVVK